MREILIAMITDEWLGLLLVASINRVTVGYS